MFSNCCCLSLYFNNAGSRQGPGKCFWGPGIFFVANPVITIIILRAIVVSEMLAEHVVL